MSVMDKMMKSTIDRMSIEEKQQMMLTMMPMMMEDVNMADTMLKMMPEMLDQISILDILHVLKKHFPDLLNGVNTVAELVSKLIAALPKMMAKMPEFMEKMMPLMEVMMPTMMGKIMPMMMTEANMERMATFPERMLPKMMEDEKLAKLMPEMMTRVMPRCLQHILPHLADEKREEFVTTLKTILENMEAADK